MHVSAGTVFRGSRLWHCELFPNILRWLLKMESRSMTKDQDEVGGLRRPE